MGILRRHDNLHRILIFSTIAPIQAATVTAAINHGYTNY